MSSTQVGLQTQHQNKVWSQIKFLSQNTAFFKKNYINFEVCE